MAGFSDDFEIRILNHIFGKATLTVPNVWVTIGTALLSDADTGATISQPTSADFARVFVSALGWSSAAAGLISNTAVISFVAAASNWGTIVAFALADASTAGNIIAFGSVNVAQAVTSGNTVYFDVGGLDVSLS